MSKRRVLGCILVLLGIISGLYCVVFYLSYKRITFGIDIIILVSIMMLLNGISKFSNKKRYIFLKVSEKIMDFILILIGVTFLTGEMLIQNGMRKNDSASSGSMVVIGYTNSEDEEIINGRIDKAVKVYNEKKYVPTLIVSNKLDENIDQNTNKSMFDKRSMEIREKMYKKGVDRFSIQLENDEYTLFGNLKNVKKLLNTKYKDYYKVNNIRVVTSDYNVFLTSLIAQEMELSVQVESVHTTFLKAPQAHVTEYIEIFKTFFFELIPYMEER